jgi:hypothetical protein
MGRLIWRVGRMSGWTTTWLWWWLLLVTGVGMWEPVLIRGIVCDEG